MTGIAEKGSGFDGRESGSNVDGLRSRDKRPRGGEDRKRHGVLMELTWGHGGYR